VSSWTGCRSSNAPRSHVRFGSTTAAPSYGRRGCYASDCVAKLFFGARANFSRGAGAFVRKLCSGSREQSDFQPAAFVSSSQGIVSPKIHFDGQISKFSRPLIFEFCNRIPPKAAAAGVRHRGSLGPGTDSCTAARKSLLNIAAKRGNGTVRPSALIANLPLHARKVPSAGPAMRGKAGTAAGRSTNVEPTKILFSGDGPALTPHPGLMAQVSNCGTAGDKRTS
jgi:hypothetical protein